jgi:hypothetical protein
MRTRSLFALLLLLLLAAVPAAADHHFAEVFAKPIEEAHGAWPEGKVFASGFTVEFGGNTVFQGTMHTDAPMSLVRLENAAGTAVVFDGEEVWQHPVDGDFQGARFHVFTWPYFLTAPLKLRDPGTHLEDLGKQPFQGDQGLPAARLTFGDGVGDTPEDWYVVYRDSQDRLAAMAYIVTFGKDTAAAEKEPHAITYHDFVTVDGVAVPTHWKFWNWSAEKGLFGEPLGEAKLTDPRFTDAGDAFERPAEAAPVPMPGS